MGGDKELHNNNNNSCNSEKWWREVDRVAAVVVVDGNDGVHAILVLHAHVSRAAEPSAQRE